jgi:hypothetical protein
VRRVLTDHEIAPEFAVLGNGGTASAAEDDQRRRGDRPSGRGARA